MKRFKHCGMLLASLLALTALLTGAAMAAESPNGACPVISVQLNGEMVPFTDVVPEVVDQRTFLPFRAVLEAMGAEVDYDAATSTVTAQRDGVSLAMTLGEKQARITENGAVRTLEMDVAAYAKNNRTYVPVRFAAEAFGCSVGWDQYQQTVVIVDVDSLFGDATFTLMDRLAAYSAKHEIPNMALAGKMTLDLEDESGEELSQPIQVSGTAEGILGDTGLQMTAEADLTSLLALAPDYATRTMLEPLLKDLSIEIRADFESEMLYFSGPIMALVVNGESADAWYSLDFGGMSAELLEAVNASNLSQLEDASVGEALKWAVKQVPLSSTSDYAVLSQMVSIYTEMLSDQAFTKEGNTYVAKTVLEDLFQITVTLTEQGEDIVAMDLTMEASADEDGMTIAFTMKEHAAPDEVTMDMDMEAAYEGFHIKFHWDFSGLPTEKVPEVTPPAGAQIIPMDE